LVYEQVNFWYALSCGKLPL